MKVYHGTRDKDGRKDKITANGLRPGSGENWREIVKEYPAICGTLSLSETLKRALAWGWLAACNDPTAGTVSIVVFEADVDKALLGRQITDKADWFYYHTLPVKLVYERKHPAGWKGEEEAKKLCKATSLGRRWA